MSLNKTLDRLFNEIRREARRNKEFADRLDAVLRAHVSVRDVPEAVMEEVTREEAREPAPAPGAARPAKRAAKAPPAPEKPAPPLNPVGLLQREGAEALETALARFDRAALAALVAEHNLDPGGEAADLDREALAAHIVAQATRRMERDRKLFDY